MKVSKKIQKVITIILNTILSIVVLSLLGFGVWRFYKGLDFFVNVKKQETQNKPDENKQDNNTEETTPSASPLPSTGLPE